MPLGVPARLTPGGSLPEAPWLKAQAHRSWRSGSVAWVRHRPAGDTRAGCLPPPIRTAEPGWR